MTDSNKALGEELLYFELTKPFKKPEYLAWLRDLHPDKSKPEDREIASKRFQEVSAAWAVVNGTSTRLASAHPLLTYLGIGDVSTYEEYVSTHPNHPKLDLVRAAWQRFKPPVSKEPFCSVIVDGRRCRQLPYSGSRCYYHTGDNLQSVPGNKEDFLVRPPHEQPPPPDDRKCRVFMKNRRCPCPRLPHSQVCAFHARKGCTP